MVDLFICNIENEKQRELLDEEREFKHKLEQRYKNL